jgi:hypothetical protein
MGGTGRRTAGAGRCARCGTIRPACGRPAGVISRRALPAFARLESARYERILARSFRCPRSRK